MPRTREVFDMWWVECKTTTAPALETLFQKNVKLQAAARGEILMVPPSTQTRVKVPVTLATKIKECNEPLVGLAHVREVLPLSNQEMEPHYYCNLCNQQGQANCMLLHLKLVLKNIMAD